jgi:rubrerythrin
MDEELTAGLRGFTNVWQRVTGAAAEAETKRPASEAARLAAFIRDENSAVSFYSALSGVCPPRCREQLLRLQRDERRHLRDLQTEHFLMTGDSCPVSPPLQHASRVGLLSALRGAYDKELESAAAYEAAAGQTTRDDLKELYRRHAEEERDHAAILYRLIRQALT